METETAAKQAAQATRELLAVAGQVLESCVPVTRLTLAIRVMLYCTSFSYVLLRLKGFIPTVTPAPHKG